MGYRFYLASMDKKEFEEFTKMTSVQVYNKYTKDRNRETDESEMYIWLYDILKEEYPLWKYFDMLSDLEWVTVDKECLYSSFEESSFSYVTKEKFEELIEAYQDQTLEYYKSLLIKDKYDFSWEEYTDEKKLRRLIGHIESKIRAFDKHKFWGSKSHRFIVNMDKDSDNIVSSWEYEHGVFELVRIYKTFDWENKFMLIHWR